MLNERMDQWEKDFFQNGYEKGISKGMSQGVLKGAYQQQKAILIRLLEAQHGTVSLETRNQIDRLSADELEKRITQALNALSARVTEL